MRKVIKIGLMTLVALTIGACGNASTFTDSRDGKVYKTVKIGKQIWMAENLAYDATGSKCYDNNPENCKKYGRLYDWKTAIEICPQGWLLPSEKEWEALVNIAGGYDVAGQNLKAQNGWNNNRNGLDKYGFSALPGGNLTDVLNNKFRDIGDISVWWSSTEYDPSNQYMGYGFSDKWALWYYMVYDHRVRKTKGFKVTLSSVRCIQE